MSDGGRLTNHAPRRRPSLASPLPPTPIVPSTPLPRANPSRTQSHHYQLPAYQQQQRPSTAPSTFSADPPDTRALMKRLMAKPAPPSSSAAVAVGSPHMLSDEQHKTSSQDQGPVQEIEISVQPTSDSLSPPQSPNEFYKSIRALDLVGQTDISMSPCIISITTETRESLDVVQRQEPNLEPDETLNKPPRESGSAKKQRNVLRRRPSANIKNTTASSSNTTVHYVPSSSETSSAPRIGQQILKDGSTAMDEGISVSTSSTPTPTPTPSAATLTTPLHPPPLWFPRHGHTQSKSSKSSRPPTPRNHSSIPDTNDTNPATPFIQPNEFQIFKETVDDAITPPDHPIPFIDSHSHSPQPTELNELAAIPYYTVFGDTFGRVVAAGGPRDAFWDIYAGEAGGGSGGAGNAYWVSRDQNSEDSGGAATAVSGGLTKVLARSVSGKRKKQDSDRQVRSEPSYQELRTPSADKDGGRVGHNRHKLKKLPDSPGVSGSNDGAEGVIGGGGGSPSTRFWKLMKKISVGGLREKNLDDPPPPVPPLPNEHHRQHHTLHNSRSTDPPPTQPRKATGDGRASISSALVLESPPVMPLGKVHKTPPPPSTPPSTSAQHHSKISHSAPHPSTTTGPRPSTTTRSSSHSSDVDSSRFFNRTQSARSSTSSFGEEMIPLPPLPKTSFSTTTENNGRTNEAKSNDTSDSRKLQQHIIPPSELIRNHSTSNFPTTPSTANANNSPSMSIPTHSPPAMEDDWTIVRSPSVELEALSLPPPPRRSALGLKGVGVGRKSGAAGRRGKVGIIPASKMLKMVNMSSEKVGDKRNQDESGPSSTRSDRGKEAQEKPTTTTTTTKQEQDDNEKDVLEKKQSHPDSNHDSDRSQSPTIPSFSTSSAINSFPARRSLSSSNGRSSGGSGDVSPTVNKLMPPSPPRQSQSSQRPEALGAFGRARQHLFGTSDVRVMAEEDEEDDERLNSLSLSRKTEIQLSHFRRLSSPYELLPQQQQQQIHPRKHHRHSSGNTTAITKSRPMHTAAASSISTSTPTSPVVTFQPHRRSTSFNTSSPPLSSPGLATSPSNLPLPSPVSRSPRSLTSPSSATVSAFHMTAPIPPSAPQAPVPSPTQSMSHRNRPSTNLRSGFSSKKLSNVLFSSSPSASPTSRTHPSSPSGHRTIGTFMSRSISIGAGNHSNVNSNTPPNGNPNTPSTTTPQRPPLTDQEKADKWNDLLARSARAGGTLHLAAGSRLLGSDDV